MRWVALVFVTCFCLGLCCDEPNKPSIQPTDGENATSDDGEPTGTPEVVDSGYLRVPRQQQTTLTWTSTGPGLLTASISWSGAASFTLSLEKGSPVAQKSGASPLQVSASVGGAGEVWTIRISNTSTTAAGVNYTLTFLAD
jgi:hypothetical protein